MRVALAILAGCAAAKAPPVVASRSAPACDVAAWREKLVCPWRVRIGGEVAIAVEHDAASVEVAQEVAGVEVGTRRSLRDVQPVVIREEPIVDGPWPGAKRLPAWAEPGARLSGGHGAWAAIGAAPGIRVAGFVPVSARGLVWEEGEPRQVARFQTSGAIVVREQADANAAVVAEVSGGTRFDIVVDTAHPGWMRVVVDDQGLRIEGWALPPTQPKRTGVYDFSDDVIEGDMVVKGNVPVDSCIRLAPTDGADVIGMVTGQVTAKDVANGWGHVDVRAAWGQVIGYVRVPPPQPAFEWKWE